MKKFLMLGIIIFSAASLTVGVSFGMNHVDYSDSDWQCKKAVGMVELAKQDYPNFVDDTLWLAEKHCGFDVDSLTS